MMPKPDGAPREEDSNGGMLAAFSFQGEANFDVTVLFPAMSEICILGGLG
jgi:hypothetical protein